MSEETVENQEQQSDSSPAPAAQGIQALLEAAEQPCLKNEPPEFEIGDTVDVHTKILEGDKERIQVFSGTVIARSGSGVRAMFTVRRIVAGEGVERKFPLHSPRIDKVVVKRSGVTRRAKLYFLRDRVGKAVEPVREGVHVTGCPGDALGAERAHDRQL